MLRTFQLPVELGPLEVKSCEYKTDIHIWHHTLKKKTLPLTFLVNFRTRAETTCEIIFFLYYQECNVTKCSYKLIRQEDTTRTHGLRKKKTYITPRPEEHYNEGLYYTREMLGSLVPSNLQRF